MLNIARIRNGLVENIEVADQEWFDSQTNDSEFSFVVIPEDQIPWVGYEYDAETGKFDRPCGCDHPELVQEMLGQESGLGPDGLPLTSGV